MGIKAKNLNYNTFFKVCDPQNGKMINLVDFIKGINSIVEIEAPPLERLFDIMDENKIGMVDFNKFTKILRLERAS